MTSKPSLVVLLSLSLVLSLPVIQVHAAAGYVPHQGDHFSYYEVENLGNGTGSYAGYSEHSVVNGTEQVNGVSGNGTVSAYYSYSWTWSNSSGTRETGSQSGSYTFSSTTFLYVKGTDDQTGYVNPYVWFAMNSSIPKDGTFYLLNTRMTVISRNYSYHLPTQDRNVAVISAQGTSSYLRNDQYGQFAAGYTWNAYFDPSTGYIVGYGYVEHDTNSSSGDGFTYTDDLYVTSTSYPLTAGGPSTTSTSMTSSSTGSTATGGSTLPPSQDLGYIADAVIVVVIVVVLIAIALSRRGRKTTLPKHSPQPFREPSPSPPISLTPKERPPVQQVVIREVAKVNCRYCGTLIDSTADVCPHCGAPRT